MTQLVVVSTLYGAANVVAALEAGALDVDGRRVLVTANTSVVPEIAPNVDELPGFGALAAHFDEIHSYNDAVAPYHPSVYMPRPADAAVFERYLRGRWRLGRTPVELVVESIQVQPSLALATIFASSRITVYAEGLMSYSPTRNPLGTAIGDRIRAVVHADLVPGLRPILLGEFGVPATCFDTKHLRDVFDRITAGIDLSQLPASTGDHVLVVGQYLATAGVLTEAGERQLHERMVRAAIGAGAGSVWFKPHPSAPLDLAPSLQEWARREHVDLVIVPPLVPAEALLAATAPAYVVGCFSTALMTAPQLYGVPAATVGTDQLLQAMTPYENSNRVPVTIVGELLEDLERTPLPPVAAEIDAERVVAELQPLVDAVAYCMQPTTYPHLAEPATVWLAAHVHGWAARYFTRGRLTSLGLPGGPPLPLWRKVAGSRRAMEARRIVAATRRHGRAIRTARRG